MNRGEGAMTVGEKLLALSREYAESVSHREDGFVEYFGLTPMGREPEEIAAEYEALSKDLHGGK
jgi:hypothetical protein